MKKKFKLIFLTAILFIFSKITFAAKLTFEKIKKNILNKININLFFI